jgi:hypothetical protein
MAGICEQVGWEGVDMRISEKRLSYGKINCSVLEARTTDEINRPALYLYLKIQDCKQTVDNISQVSMLHPSVGQGQAFEGRAGLGFRASALPGTTLLTVPWYS